MKYVMVIIHNKESNKKLSNQFQVHLMVNSSSLNPYRVTRSNKIIYNICLKLK